MRTVMTSTGAFGFYAGLNLIAWAMIFFFVRETKQLTLEEIDRTSSSTHFPFLAASTDAPCRGLLRPNGPVRILRSPRSRALVLQAILPLPEAHPHTTSYDWQH